MRLVTTFLIWPYTTISAMYVPCLQPTRRVQPARDQVFKHLSWWGIIHNQTTVHLMVAGIHSRFYDWSFHRITQNQGTDLQNNYIFTIGILRLIQLSKNHDWSSLSRGFTPLPPRHQLDGIMPGSALYSVGWQKDCGRNLKFFPRKWAQNREPGILKNLFMGLWNSQLWFHSLLIISFYPLPPFALREIDTSNNVPNCQHGFKCMMYQIQYSVSKRYPWMGKAV